MENIIIANKEKLQEIVELIMEINSNLASVGLSPTESIKRTCKVFTA